MKPVEQLTVKETFDRLSIAIYYGMAMRGVMGQSPRALQAAKDLLAVLRQDPFLREQTEKE